MEIIRPKNRGKSWASAFLPYVKSVSEKIKGIGSLYNIRTVFKTKHTLRSSLIRAKPQGDPKQTADVAEIVLGKQVGCYLYNLENIHRMACLENAISQPSLEISPIWILLISKEIEAEVEVTVMNALYADNSNSEIKPCQAHTPFGILAV
jgi:hypothetical protein